METCARQTWECRNYAGGVPKLQDAPSGEWSVDAVEQRLDALDRALHGLSRFALLERESFGLRAEHSARHEPANVTFDIFESKSAHRSRVLLWMRLPFG